MAKMAFKTEVDTLGQVFFLQDIFQFSQGACAGTLSLFLMVLYYSLQSELSSMLMPNPCDDLIVKDKIW